MIVNLKVNEASGAYPIEHGCGRRGNGLDVAQGVLEG